MSDSTIATKLIHIGRVRIERRGGRYLTEYLKQCYDSLQQTTTEKDGEDLLKELYNAFYDKKESVCFSDLYKLCFALIQNHQSHIFKNLGDKAYPTSLSNGVLRYQSNTTLQEAIERTGR